MILYIYAIYLVGEPVSRGKNIKIVKYLFDKNLPTNTWVSDVIFLDLTIRKDIHVHIHIRLILYEILFWCNFWRCWWCAYVCVWWRCFNWWVSVFSNVAVLLAVRCTYMMMMMMMASRHVDVAVLFEFMASFERWLKSDFNCLS